MILAGRLGNDPFKKWVEQELNGYPSGADLPAYRRITGASSIGQFAGGFGAALRNVPLPLSPLPAKFRARFEKVEFREGVAKLEEMARGDGELISRWPGDLVALVADKFYDGYTLIEAHVEIPKSAVIGVLDAVRNSALKFSLEIEEEAPAAGEVAPGTKPLPDEKVSQIFNTYISGAQNVAVGSPAAVQHAQQIQAGDLESLRKFLGDHGVEAADVAALELAIRDDPAPTKGGFGKRVAKWVGEMVSKAASGAWEIGTSTATEALTAAIKAYYGL